MWFCVAVIVTVPVFWPLTSPAVSPFATPVSTLSVPCATDSVTVMAWFAGSASTSVIETPVIAVWTSSLTDGLAGRWFTGASFLASMFSVVWPLFWAPKGTLGAPSLTVQEIVRVVAGRLVFDRRQHGVVIRDGVVAAERELLAGGVVGHQDVGAGEHAAG